MGQRRTTRSEAPAALEPDVKRETRVSSRSVRVKSEDETGLKRDFVRPKIGESRRFRCIAQGRFETRAYGG